MSYTILKETPGPHLQPCRAAGALRWSFSLIGIVGLSFLLTGTGLAEEVPPDAAQVQGPPSPYEPLPSEKPSAGTNESSTVFKPIRNWWNDTLSWETGAGRSYVLPAGEILLYQFLLNLYDRNFVEPTSDYDTDWDTIWDHITDPHWVVDTDQFQVNQFLHPYGGSIYYGLARSTGLNFWESFLYSVAGSYVWELAGETTNPSINDMVATPVGGTFLGEPFFRMASLILEDAQGKPGFWRELGAAVIAPPLGFNRLVFGNKFDAIFPSHKPATFMRLQAGGTLSSSSRNVSSGVEENGAVADFTFTYGLPGKPGYTYKRPFDYFDFHVRAVTANVVESINSRGLLLGTPYAAGESTRGIWDSRKLRLYFSAGVSCVEYGLVTRNDMADMAVPDSGTPGNGARRWRLRSGRQYREDWRTRLSLWDDSSGFAFSSPHLRRQSDAGFHGP